MHSLKEYSYLYLFYRIFSLVCYSRRTRLGVCEESGFFRGDHWTFRI